MNPGDVAQSVLPLTSSDLSLFALFWQAHWLVKSVMVGLLVASVWVWAIVIDKILLYHPHPQGDGPLRAGVLVGPVAGGTLQGAVGAPDPFDGGAVCRGDARMEAQLREPEPARSPACRPASRR